MQNASSGSRALSLDGTQSTNVYHLDKSRHLGSVTQVLPARVVIELSVLERRLLAKENETFPLSLGSYVVIGRQEFALVGQVNELRNLGVDQTSGIEAVVDLFSSISLREHKVIPGVLQPPHIGDPVFAPTTELIEFIVSGDSDVGTVNSKDQVRIALASLRNVEETPINVLPERLFGRHCAILGATGGGKSWTLARIVEETAKFKAKIVLFDATGEYEKLGNGEVKHVHFGEDKKAREDSEQIVVPYHHLSEQDLFAMFRPTGPSQASKLRAALKSLKLAQVSQSVGINGAVIKAHKSKRQYERSMHHHKKAIDAPYAPFDIRLLPQQIENECVEQQRSATEPDVWGGTNSIDLGNCMPLISRIHDMLQAHYLEPIFKPRNFPSVFERLHNFIRTDEHRVLRINMRNLSFAFDTRRIIANSLGRHLFELGQLGCFQKRPLVTVIDEAHQFLTDEKALDEGLTLNTFGLIAKEGRKYSLTLCIATQRPRDIPEDILSQMGTLLVHRLINDNDRSIIERASGDVDESSLRLIPSLAPGEAMLTGVDFPLPLHVRIHAPLSRPVSSGADYQSFWKLDQDS
ncbi:MAG: ATP-binding protein [Bdellovibrionales bacterium]|nr:ATP-binding protein [Bdellovibrionales bacterium]